MSRRIDVLVVMLGVGIPAIGIALFVLLGGVGLLTRPIAKQSPAMRTRILILEVTRALEKAHRLAGRRPSSAPIPSNPANTGIEAVAALLYEKDLALRERPATAGLGNTDGDRSETTSAIHEKLDRFEFVDAWGHPLVYLERAAYEAADRDGFPYVNGRGEEVRARPWRDATAGWTHEMWTYQIFSMGPDGIPNTDDDVAEFLR